MGTAIFSSKNKVNVNSSSNATNVFDMLKHVTTGDATFYYQQIIDWESICSLILQSATLHVL